MSIALDSSSTRIDIAPSSGLVACGLLFDSPETCRRVPAGEAAVSSTTSSSIGNNSDDESGSDDGENDEAQSSYKGPLDMMNALEEVLPMRRGISKFYNYKSKSFTSLAEASSSSNIKDLAKPDNAYTRKRRNLLASNNMLEKNRSFPLRSNGGGISKRPISTSRSTLALAVKLSSCSETSTSSTSEDSNSSSTSMSPRALPPYHPVGNSAAWRSYSLADLQECATSAATVNASRFSTTKPNMQH